MNTLFPELNGLSIELDDETRDRQFAAIVDALDAAPAAAPSVLVRARAAWRRWTVTLAAAATGLVPVAAAASESAVPGDALYPIKLTVERVQLLFDADIDAEHRVAELETVLGSEESDAAVVESIINDTIDVLRDTPQRTDLIDRADEAIDAYQDRLSDARTDDAARDRPAEPTPTDRAPETDATTTTEAVRDDVDTTTTTVADTTTTTTREADRPTTTTAPADGDGRGGDDAPPSDGTGDRP